ncbi:TIGR03086 family metal-binding protein [Kribbella sp. CA-293567]|uniref:TIGR03086 family metal-binding protein n=1 Tax=Kribbella sp. CA-293567 TaxID=3002436 RepID=UPI0022DD451A|nr:TIGR03086 family metal-binding protein [Kribbella sp. CA-293567]WBQ04787.1 TIGR03086 family metal-binding protein [Kribbella sp. CA-293567]
MGEVAERYRRRAEAFEQKIAGVRPEQWGNQSPCDKWSARDVVDHIVAMHGYLLRPVGRTVPPDEDPLPAFRNARAAVEQVLAAPDLAGQECDTPAGRMTVEEQIDQVVSDDLVLHGWDLARATGQDETMDPVDVERLWASNSAIPAEVIERYRTPGAFGPGIEVFGPEVVVPADAPLQARLLGFIGRHP